ncbi:MAG: hypothetical protein SOZ43_02745 [Eubacteriales bacterium]|nr:hypothetical protein [Eubacteriales bacterium]
MVRGIQKQVIHVKNPENSWCEEAFLVVRAGAFAPESGVTMAEEVERMLDGTRNTRETYEKKSPGLWRRWSVAVLFLLGGICLGAALTLLLM